MLRRFDPKKASERLKDDKLGLARRLDALLPAAKIPSCRLGAELQYSMATSSGQAYYYLVVHPLEGEQKPIRLIWGEKGYYLEGVSDVELSKAMSITIKRLAEWWYFSQHMGYALPDGVVQSHIVM